MFPKLTIICWLICTFHIGHSQTTYVQFSSQEEQHHFLRWEKDRIPLISAHRGGIYAEYPENSLEAFEHTFNQHFAIIEFDVSMTVDSVLVLMHDRTVDRTTTGSGVLGAMTFNEVRKLRLKRTDGTPTNSPIPTFTEALIWLKNKTIATVDIKKGVPVDRLVKEIRATKAEKNVVVITYSAEQAAEVYRIAPDLMISVILRNEDELQRHLQLGIPANRMVAFTGVTLLSPAWYERLHQLNILCILGTMGNIDNSAKAKGDQVYRNLIESGVDILSTDRPVEAGQAIKQLIPLKSTKHQYFRK